MVNYDVKMMSYDQTKGGIILVSMPIGYACMKHKISSSTYSIFFSISHSQITSTFHPSDSNCFI